MTNSSTSTSAGEKAPQFTLKDFYGTEYSLSQFKGKVVFIDFWASWCPPCRAAAPKLEELYEEYKDKSDKVQIMGINLDQNKTQAEQFIQKENISYLILQGGQSSVSKEYKISGIPAFYLIDAEGTIVKRYVGFRPSYAQEWRDEINKLIQ